MTPSVYEQLHEKIINGELAAGVRLTETGLAETFGISRTPIREALRRLEQDGLVERAGRGMHVKLRSPHQILEIYDVRIILEAAAARSAAEHASELDLARLRQMHESMAVLDPHDTMNMMKRNRQFHEHIWAMSRNATLIDLLKRLGYHVMRYRGTTLTHQDRWQHALDEHAALIEAMAARDGDLAADIAKQHMTRARDARLQMYAEGDG